MLFASPEKGILDFIIRLTYIIKGLGSIIEVFMIFLLEKGEHTLKILANYASMQYALNFEIAFTLNLCSPNNSCNELAPKVNLA